MIDWLVSIFLGGDINIKDDERIRIFLLFVTIVATFSTVLLNQGFNSRRQSKAFKSEKLELLYETISDIELAADNLEITISKARIVKSSMNGNIRISYVEMDDDLHKACKDNWSIIKNSYQKANMLNELYFNHLGGSKFFNSARDSISTLETFVLDLTFVTNELDIAHADLIKFTKEIKMICIKKSLSKNKLRIL